MSWFRDFAIAVRSLGRKPSFALATVLLLAFGIGVATASFSLLDQLFWRPFPGVAPDPGLLAVHSRFGSDAAADVSSYADLRELRARSRTLAEVVAYKGIDVGLDSGAGEPEPVRAMAVSQGYFALLGLTPAHGRFLRPDENTRPGATVAVLGHGLWTRRFAGSPDVVGRTVDLDGVPFTVVGVAPEGFRGTSRETEAELFLPIATLPHFMGRDLLDDHGWGGVIGLARLAPGVGMDAAAGDTSRIARELAAEFPATNAERSLLLEPLVAGLGSAARREGWAQLGGLLAATAGLVLLVACANAANLLSARTSGRRVELATRQALGATSRRLAGVLMLEAVVLALAGAGLGTLLARVAVGWVRDLPLGLAIDAAVDHRAVGAALALALLTAATVGLAPILEARAQVADRIRQGSGTRRTSRLRSTLVVLQVSSSLVLLAGTGLLARTLGNLAAAPLGFPAAGLISGEVGLGATSTDDEVAATWRRVADAARQLPGVRAASLTTILAGGDDYDQMGIRVGDGPAAGEEALIVPVQAIGADYFATLGVPLLAGRELKSLDEQAGRPHAVVNESFARRHFPAGAAVGRTVQLTGGPVFTVVGVARDSRSGNLRETPGPYLYLPWYASPEPLRRLNLVVREAGPRVAPRDLRNAAVSAGAMWMRNTVPLEERLEWATRQERLAATILSALSAGAVVLATLGLYSLLSWSVAQRTREIGIRSALGADGGRLRREVLADGLRLTALGVALGLAGAVAAAWAIRGVLFGVSAADPLTLVAVAAVLFGAGGVAAWRPACRATEVDPLVALREG
jgi:putative ABC transport system permease protein